MYDELDYDEIQRRVTQRVQRRYRFFFHTTIFIVGIPIIGQWQSPVLFVMWVAAWMCHLLWVSYHHHLQQAIEEEIQHEQQRLEKRKRDHHERARHQQRREPNYDDERYPVDGDADYYDELPGINGHHRPGWLSDDGEIIRYDDRQQ